MERQIDFVGFHCKFHFVYKFLYNRKQVVPSNSQQSVTIIDYIWMLQILFSEIKDISPTVIKTVFLI